ncbi:anaerobic carbon-monoxide dehydrogenase catalytic subunit [Methanofollis tationis]|uniref:Carbon monoxide dehydrogenase n=1 Tax=Methanofollis tationis TaxID=81417 RepID=A0A7K4HQE1_9EURY|nr:anaerobic carbon-monoxide dehydrogenase catalytic subunit [Methanofollis tationis]NVO67483.1 anaerobic carbon-monoxide dehydrogenase catalytic subunit [Methanofollis tationis]
MEEKRGAYVRERIACTILERAKLSLMNPALIEAKVEERTIDETAKPLIRLALEEGIETAWDRYEQQQPPCRYCASGLSCSRCAMGPCRIIPERQRFRGVCGADADLVVARNLLDMIATGAAAHSDHGREIVETLHKAARGEAEGYGITDPGKLRRVAGEYGIETGDRDDAAVAGDVALAMLEEFGTVKNAIQFVQRAPPQTLELWEAAGITPRSVDREIVEAMHRVHMGVGADYANVLLQGLRASLGDGWGGSLMATETSDILFGTPQVNMSRVNLAVLKDDRVNIALHGHNPVLSEMIVRAAAEPAMLELAEEAGSAGINLVGLCCTGNELLMRKGIPQAGNHLNQELIIATGALEVMIVDYQCIFPSLPRTASCFHTHIVSTSPKSKVPGSLYYPFYPESALETAREIVSLAIANFPNRNPGKVLIPGEPVEAMTGFSVEAIGHLFGGFKPVIDAIAEGSILGAAGVVGCNNPKVRHDEGHVTLTKELIRRGILVVETGCAAIASGKAGLLRPEAADLAAPGLANVCRTFGIPPVLHMGSCVDCSRILVLAAGLARELGVGIHQLPIAGAAPEWYSQKAVSIGSYFVASGVFTVLGVMPKIAGSGNVADLLTRGLNGLVHASFAVEPDPVRAADLIEAHIREKRNGLGI